MPQAAAKGRTKRASEATTLEGLTTLALALEYLHTLSPQVGWSAVLLLLRPTTCLDCRCYG